MPYKCILYEEGDIVFRKYPSADSKPMKVIGTRLDVLGKDTITQFLQFEGCNDDLEISNLYIPYGETINKYKDGLSYYTGIDKDGNVKKSDTKIIILTKSNKTESIPTQAEITFKPFTKTP